jgi:class 3 adenylate cyclase/tetratricopeptide (TPR) repeat protein
MAKFCPQCAQPTGATASPQARSPQDYTPAHLARKILRSRTALEGERKQVTVLFADLKASMELLADRDPEEARKLLDPVLELMMEAVHHYEGTVSNAMGDGIVALFGAPLAHEDHAIRASYAALRMQERIKRHAKDVLLTHGVNLQIRVGLNSGDVVVRTISSDLHMDYSAIGRTTHLAARMEQLATPGSILLTPATLRLAEGFVATKSLGAVAIKGLFDPLEVHVLTGIGLARTRLQAGARRGLTPFVGRDDQLAELHRTQQRAREGHGQVAAIVAEPGVGKSRLLYELTRSASAEDWLVLECGALSYGKSMGYLPVISLLKSYFEIGEQDSLELVSNKVTTKLGALDRALEPTLPALLALLDAPVEDTTWLTLDPSQRRQRTLDAVRHLLLRQARRQPVLLIFEDVHWIDAETQALLDGLVESLGSARILLLVTYRPEYRHAWAGKSYFVQMRLDALAAQSTAELLDALLGEDAALAPLKRLLVRRGNPFFLEETVRTLVETKALEGSLGEYRIIRPVETIEVPATVQIILAARIDRLSTEDKHLLQIAAAVGRNVPFSLLLTVVDLADELLRQSLYRLQAAEFIYERGLFPDLEYSFKHALTQDVAYGSMLHEQRRELHAAIVEAIEVLYHNRLGEQVERLAHHARQGEVWEKALHYLHQAGTKVFLRSANREAATYFEQALDALRHLPETRDAIAESLDLRFDLRNALVPLGEGGRMGALLDEARALAEAIGDQHRLGRALTYQVLQFWQAGDYAAALQASRRALAIGESLANESLQVVAELYLGRTYLARGECQEAVQHCEAAVNLIPETMVQERFGQAAIPASFVGNTLAIALGALGRFAEAFGRVREAMRIAENAEHVYSLLFPLFGFGILKLDQGDFLGAVAPLERGFELCRAREVPAMLHDFGGALGAAYHGTGRRAEGLAMMEDAARGFAEQNLRWQWWAGRVGALGEAYLIDGRLADASRIAQGGLVAARQRGERGVESQILRLLGDIAAHPDHFEFSTAEERYRQALASGEALGLRPLVAHCHLSLGILYRRTGEPEQCRNHLITATTMYHEMKMSFWSAKAEAEVRQH